jgi:hypothetical protein
MAIVFLQEFKIDGDDRSTTNYDAIMSQLDLEANPPDGLIVHTAGWDEEAGVFRILDVWESKEHGETYLRETLQPLLDQGPANPENAGPPDRVGMYELHDIISP